MIGGVEKYLSWVIPNLLLRDHQIIFIHEVDTPIGRKAIHEGETWCTAALGEEFTLRKAREWRPDLFFVNSFSESRLIEKLTDGVPSFFFCHDYVGTCISGTKMTQFPVAQPCSRNFGFSCLTEYYPRHCGGWNPLTMWNTFHWQSERLNVLRKGSMLITASEAMKAEYLRHGFGNNSVYCVPYGLEMSERWEKTILDSPWRLLFVGRMEAVKGGDLLIRALPKVAVQLRRKMSLVFVGDGRVRSDWVRAAKVEMAKTDSINITFLGWLSHQALADQYLEADLAVMPSVWPEPFGLSGLEPGQYRIPSVAFDVGGISDWLRDGENGHVAPGRPPKVSGLADAIVRCLQHSLHYRRLCEGAREIAGAFEIQNHMDKLLELFSLAANPAELDENVS
jgi:glycosyltransferase involved in cell wall biosynthesis